MNASGGMLTIVVSGQFSRELSQTSPFRALYKFRIHYLIYLLTKKI